MGMDWREKCPLHGAEQYLWKKLKEFPSYDHWNPKERPAKGSLHEWYENGWSQLRSLEDNFFACSSVHGGHDWEFAHQRCQWDGCKEPADSLVNQRRTGKKDQRGDDEWELLPDAPHFYCHAHYHEFAYGQKYIPPTREEIMRSRALFRATARMMKEQPAEQNGNLSFVLIDRDYLKRMVEIAEEEYQELNQEPLM